MKHGKHHRTGSSEVAIICRSEKAKEPLEWQADYFASCLLMPEKAVRITFARLCGSTTPLFLENWAGPSSPHPFSSNPVFKNWPLIAQAAINAGGFENVSKQAMIIRLQDLGLLVNFTDHTSWAGQMRLQVAKNSTGKKFCPSSSIKSNIC